MKRLLTIVVLVLIIAGGIYWFGQKNREGIPPGLGYQKANFELEFKHPEGGEVFYPGQKVDIKWSTGNVRKSAAGGFLNLYNKSESIGDGIRVDFSSGHYLWTVPSATTNNNGYWLHIEAISGGDPGIPLGAGKSNPFSIQ